MTTQEVADRLVTLCKAGKWNEAQAELYCPDCTSTEPAGSPNPGTISGMDAIKKKGEMWDSMVEEVHSMDVEGPIVAGDHFTCAMKMDITFKGRGRSQDQELCVYKVKDGKIVSESFVY